MNNKTKIMGTNFNLNRGMENPKTGRYVLPIIIFLVIVATVVTLYLTFNGKHNKLPGIEVVKIVSSLTRSIV